MAPKDCEKYIMSKANAVKTVIAKWRYIRYTIYASTFATLEDHAAKGTVLTVFGKFPQYQEQFAHTVVDAVNNDPKYFTSVLLSEGITPEHVIKTMIDDSYRRRLRCIPLPRIAEGRGDIPYCGIAPLFSEDPIPGATERQTVESAMQTSPSEEETYEYAAPRVAQAPEITMVGSGRWDNIPYTMVSNETYIKHLIKLTDRKQKAESEICSAKAENNEMQNDT